MLHTENRVNKLAYETLEELEEYFTESTYYKARIQDLKWIVKNWDTIEKDLCKGDCDNCKYAYYKTDHEYFYEESKLHCKLIER